MLISVFQMHKVCYSHLTNRLAGARIMLRKMYKRLIEGGGLMHYLHLKLQQCSFLDFDFGMS